MDRPPVPLLFRLALLLALAACGEGRNRPGPTDLSPPALLSVEVVSPRNNEAVAGGRATTVIVRGGEPNGRLAGVGVVARRFAGGGELIDSIAFRFSHSVRDSARSFQVVMPNPTTSSMQVDVYGLAFGPESQAKLSEPQAIIVLRCTADVVWCN
ncbi:MAG: hypothetical protein HY561_07350 [Gemmatimonadetes bacterium]|nr:hypothetical protein [Gemmatimonadota bacterium]